MGAAWYGKTARLICAMSVRVLAGLVGDEFIICSNNQERAGVLKW